MKMLIIEDDVIYVGLLERYLEGLADEIIIAKSWEEAKQHIQVAQIMWIDLIIPPHNEDFAIVQIGEIRAQNSNAVIFVVSGVVSPDTKREALAAGADYFAEKMDHITQNQIIALMISALMKAQERGSRESLTFLQRARELINERVNPVTT